MNRFPSLIFFLIVKKLDNEKLNPTIFIFVLKYDTTIVGLAFLISNFFKNKTTQGRKSVHGILAQTWPDLS
jgi:hypothetical protein